MHLKLKGFRPSTIDGYARAIRCLGHYFNDEISELSRDQLLEYFNQVLEQRSWSTLKHRLYGVSFFYIYVLERPWQYIKIVRPPRPKRIPDILTREQVAVLLGSFNRLVYRVLFVTIYTMGLRLNE